ncbi:MAG: GNAT family N-acetyltransferase, partial [Ilumatobacteraceae bacterium]
PLRSIEFGTPGESRARLVDFIINGNKRATAGLLHDYVKEGEPLEHVGECLAMVDNDGKHVATLHVTRVEVTRLADVPDEFALAEAEGDLNAADFRASHLEYWTCAGEEITDDTQVVQVYFDLLSHRLRELQPNDAEWIHRACQDPDIQRWTMVPRPYTREHAESFVVDRGGELSAYAIVSAPTNEPVGVAGLHHVRDGVASVGYWVAPWGRGNGAAADALRILRTIIGHTTQAHTVRALIAETNVASRRTAERANFTMAGLDSDTCPDGTNQAVALRYEIPAH